MKKPARLRIKPDETGALRVFLFAGNGAELFRSPTVLKRGNGERTVDRIREAMQVAILEPGPRQEPAAEDADDAKRIRSLERRKP